MHLIYYQPKRHPDHSQSPHDKSAAISSKRPMHLYPTRITVEEVADLPTQWRFLYLNYLNISPHATVLMGVQSNERRRDPNFEGKGILRILHRARKLRAEKQFRIIKLD